MVRAGRKLGVQKTFNYKNKCGIKYKIEKRKDPDTGKRFYRALNTAGEYLNDYKKKESAKRRSQKYADTWC